MLNMEESAIYSQICGFVRHMLLMLIVLCAIRYSLRQMYLRERILDRGNHVCFSKRNSAFY